MNLLGNIDPTLVKPIPCLWSTEQGFSTYLRQGLHCKGVGTPSAITPILGQLSDVRRDKLDSKGYTSISCTRNFSGRGCTPYLTPSWDETVLIGRIGVLEACLAILSLEQP